jgi:hypothetical protein
LWQLGGNRSRPRRRKAWHVDAMCDCPASGGEPLWHVQGDLAMLLSALNPPTKCRNRRLPRITQRDDLPAAPISFTPAPRTANRWTVPGSRLFLHVSARFDVETNFARANRLAPKRLPSGRWTNAHRIKVPGFSRTRMIEPRQASTSS